MTQKPLILVLCTGNSCRHWGFDDPAHATGTEEEKLPMFRRVRDEIRRVFEG
jgi:protein-tyrosine-phosphatase